MFLLLVATFATAALGTVGLARRSHILRICHILVSRNPSLSFPPSHLTSIDVVFILLAVAFKSLLNAFGLVPKLELWSEEQKFSLLAITITAPVVVKDVDVQRYGDALSVLASTREDAREKLRSPTLLLAGLTTPLMLLTLANYQSPILPLGAVNTKNRFEFLVADISPYLNRKMFATAKFGGPQNSGRQTRHGIEFDIIIEVTAAATTDGQSSNKAIFRQHITIMQKLTKKLRLNTARSAETRLVDHSQAVSSREIRVPYTAPRVWARLCKDYNPIHVSALAARLFGFPGKIAHGNHIVCVALDTIERDIAARKRTVKAVEVEFKRPMVLPMTMRLSYQEAKQGQRVLFEAHREQKTHVEGAVILV